MQFKHPEILYVLFALLIPVFIHLFQLQRFVKTPFTNVKFLKEIQLQTRKSSRLKKWLVLLTRLGVFASIIIAFAQPYFSTNKTSKEWLTTIYLDNSLSMKTKGDQGELLKRSIQDIAKNLPDKGVFNLMTNDGYDVDLSRQTALEKLKIIDYSTNSLSLKTVLLKLQNIENNNKEKLHTALLISDFQKSTENEYRISKKTIPNKSSYAYIQLESREDFNVSIDSVAISNISLETIQLDLTISHRGKSIKSVNLSAYHNDIVLAKNTFDLASNETKIIKLSIPKKQDNILIKIDVDDAFLFDNEYRISFNQPEKINVLLIGDSNSFINKIFTKEEFKLTQKKQNQLSFDLIDTQQLIVIDGLNQMPLNFHKRINEFIKEGGSLAVIPAVNAKLENLNSFFTSLGIGELRQYRSDSLQVTKIHFSHPILKGVFDKRVSNFQYPKVNNYYLDDFKNKQAVLSFENEQTFVSQINKGKGKIYWVAAPLDSKSSNFTKAPLIVPVFYNMAKQSLSRLQLSYRVGQTNKIMIKQSLGKEEVLQIENKYISFIPRQEIQPDKVLLFTENKPNKPGFYQVTKKEKPIQNIAYNAPKSESLFSFYNLNKITDNSLQKTKIEDALNQLKSNQQTQSYFKWFVLLAMLFIILEILLLKYF